MKLIEYFKKKLARYKLNNLTGLEKGIIYVNQFYFDQHPESLESDPDLKTELIRYYEHIILDQFNLNYDIKTILSDKELLDWGDQLNDIMKQSSSTMIAKIRLRYDSVKKNL